MDASKKRVALVTGGSRGLGKVIALTLARRGMDIIICGRNKKTLKETATEIINKYGVSVSIVQVDATNKSVKTLKKVFAYVAQYHHLDVLVNNVGRAEPFGDFFSLSDRDWIFAYELNFMTAVRFSREAIPWLRKSDCPRIINISSVPARQPGLFNPHYSSAKVAMINLSKYMANILGKYGITVNAICPGTLKGGGWEANVRDRAMRANISFEDAEKLMESEEIAKVPLKKMGTPEDVAELVAFFASPESRFITGTCVNVDGGTTRAIM